MAAIEPMSERIDSAESGAESATHCFHCGLPVTTGTNYGVIVDSKYRSLCCPGCEAVASAIVSAGLTDYYRHRDDQPQRREDLVPAQLRQLELYDRPELQQSFVHRESEHLREASLILEGIVCAACVWLNERHVSALPGVLSFHVNYSNHRAQVRWDERRTQLSDILKAIAAIGYSAHPFDPGRQETLQKQERAQALRRLAVAGLGAMQVMMLAVALYFGDYYGMDEGIRRFMRWVSLIFATPVLLYSARPFFSAAWRDLRRGRLGMDVPVAMAIGGAFAASIWNTWQGSGEVYYDSATMFTFLLLGGRFLEMSARHRAGRLSEALVPLLPATAARLSDSGTEDTVAVAELQTGDRVLIRPGETVPADGRVCDGSSHVDESLLSGESHPVPKGPDDALIGGSVNGDSPLIMAVENVGANTVLSSIVRLLDRAQGEKPALGAMADRIAGYFVAVVLLTAAGVAWWWWLQAPSEAFAITLSVLVITCPCALSLATPTALTVATGSLTRAGLLITRGHALETLARVTHVGFDKTGTLTHGQLKLISTESLRPAPEPVVEIAAALERGSEHPVGYALAEVARTTLAATEVRNRAGQGVEGWVNHTRYRLGTAEFVGALKGSPSELPETGPANTTRVALGNEQGLLAWFHFADQLRPGAGTMISDLRALGLQVFLLSGDRPPAVEDIARQVSITDARGNLLPQQKLARIQALQHQGAIVAMVGDGINDAPVLAGAQASIAMGGGTQLAHASADMVLLSGQLDRIPLGVRTARRTLNIIRQNIGWALTYNFLALPMAAAGWITPWMAALGMSLSSLLVVANASRLRQN